MNVTAPLTRALYGTFIYTVQASDVHWLLQFLVSINDRSHTGICVHHTLQTPCGDDHVSQNSYTYNYKYSSFFYFFRMLIILMIVSVFISFIVGLTTGFLIVSGPYN